MTTPDIPEDIRERARMVYDEVSAAQPFIPVAVKVIALALLSERNRAREEAFEEAAKIAEAWGENVSTIAYAGPPPTLQQAANLIAASIREGTKP